MKEWRQTITVICTVVLAFAALAVLMQFELAVIRAEMSSEHAQMREEMVREHAQIREEMSREHAQMRGEHAAIRAQLSSIDRRTARIEGHLFGIEIVPDSADGPDSQRLELDGMIAAPDFDPILDMRNGGAHNLFVQDEIKIAPPCSHWSEAAVIEGLEVRSERTNIIPTGRDAKPALCKFADFFSETRTFKRAFDAGIKAILCIGF